jgi:hypothetical protein
MRATPHVLPNRQSWGMMEVTAAREDGEGDDRL